MGLEFWGRGRKWHNPGNMGKTNPSSESKQKILSTQQTFCKTDDRRPARLQDLPLDEITMSCHERQAQAPMAYAPKPLPYQQGPSFSRHVLSYGIATYESAAKVSKKCPGDRECDSSNARGSIKAAGRAGNSATCPLEELCCMILGSAQRPRPSPWKGQA